MISPATLRDGIISVRAEAKNTPHLLNSLVSFVQDQTPYLAQITDVMTFNPYMDPSSPLGRGNMSFVSNRGRVPHTEDSDIRFVNCKFLSLLGADNQRYKLRNSPDVGLDIVEASSPILQLFYPFSFPENIAIGKYLNTDLPLPLNVKKLKEVHCGIFGITGWGKSVLQAYLAALYVRSGSKVLIFDHTGEYALPGSLVQLIFNELVGKGKFRVIKASQIRADHDLLSVKFADIDFWVNALATSSSYAQRVASEVTNVVRDKYASEADVLLLNKARFLDIINEVIPLCFGAQTAGQKVDLIKRRKSYIERWFEETITPYLKRPLTFTDLRDDVTKEKAVVVDLTGEEMPLSEKALYVFKIGSLIYSEAKTVYEKENKKQLGLVVVVDEAHNYVPEFLAQDDLAQMWQKKSKGLITTLAKEGRKYGMGLCLADQRITAVDKEAIDFQTYFLGKLQMKGDQDHIKSMFGETTLTALSALREYQFVVVGGANPLEDAAAPVQVFDPKSDLDYVAKLHS